MNAYEERGYGHLEGSVCVNCMHNPALKEFLLNDHSIGDCDYCENTGIPVSHADRIQDHIIACIGSDYEDIQNSGAPYESREGGYQVKNEEAMDIVSDNLASAVDENFCTAVVESINPFVHWCERDWSILSPRDYLKYGWQKFCATVRHSLRYAFAWAEGDEDESHPDHIHPAKTLTGIGGMVDSLGLTQILPVGTTIYRVRVHANEYFETFEDLGSPPPQKAATNRMSPAGIPMFYGADSVETAIRETWDEQNSAKASIGTFTTRRPLKVVNFKNVPPVPSYWSNPGREKAARFEFMRNLAEDLSEPVERGSLVDLHYAPTQIVCEYLVKARRVSDPDLSTGVLHGIAFASSRTTTTNFAFNLCRASDECSPYIQNDFLELVSVEHRELLPSFLVDAASGESTV